MKPEFEIEQIRDFVNKGYTSVSARYVKAVLQHYDELVKNCIKPDVISRFKSVDKYDIWFDQGGKYIREGIAIEKNNDDGEWIKASDVEAILNGL